MKLALSMLCENPRRRTGLTTLFHEFVSRGLKLFPSVHWLLFAGPNQEWTVDDPRIEVDRTFPANDQLNRRLAADHFKVPSVALAKGADALLTVGFVPARKCLPTAMHVFSLQHLDKNNRIGPARELYRRWMMKFSWPRADLIITNSDFAKSQILSVYPNFQDRIVRSYEGVQHEQFNPTAAKGEADSLKAQFNLEPGYFLWISNFYPYKQPELLLAGYARLAVEVRRRHPLVMVGGSWEGVLEAAQAQAKNLRIAEDVRFLDWVDDHWIAPLYRHALAFCLASREETFGRCVLEAMACGIPCVVNDIQIMREVTDGHAILLDYKETSRLAAMLTEVAADATLRARLRLVGLERAQHFSFDRLTTERITAIQRVVSAKHTR
jgi:glycosyltransferase involved in cell wall biosynthesis